MTNEQAIRKFAEPFDPPLNVAATKRVNSQIVVDGWMAAGRKVTEGGVQIGFTAVCYGNGVFKAFAEVVGGRDTAEDAGQLFSGMGK